MTQEWQKKVHDPRERKLFEALSDPAWDFRTVEGISRVTALHESKIFAIFRKYSELIRKSAVPDAKGRDLYTLRSRPRKAQEFFAEIRLFVTKTTR